MYVIYRTEPATKTWKTENLRKRNGSGSEVSVNSPRGIRGVSPEEEKGTAKVGRICRKGRF